eukprot:234062-Pyramimonas_sp.AAC.1
MEQAPFVASSLLHVLSVSARLPVSVPKLALLTSDPALAEGVIQAVPVLRSAPRAQNARNLGIDFTLRPRRGLLRHVRKARIKEVMHRARRTARLRKAGASVGRLVRSGLQPVVMYGSGVTGMSTVHIQQIRSAYRVAMCSRSHRCVTMDLAMEKIVNPALPAHTEVVLAYLAY